MNLEEIRKTRDFIAELPESACDMRHWLDGDDPNFMSMKANGFQCGAVGCIGGWTGLRKSIELGRRCVGVARVAYEILDLTSVERARLFHQYPEDVNYKAWILARLARVLEMKEIEPWYRIPELAAERFRK